MSILQPMEQSQAFLTHTTLLSGMYTSTVTSKSKTFKDDSATYSPSKRKEFICMSRAVKEQNDHTWNSCILRSGSKVCTNRSGTTRPDSKHSVGVGGDGVPALPIPIGFRSTVNPGNKRAVLKLTIATASCASARIYLHYNDSMVVQCLRLGCLSRIHSRFHITRSMFCTSIVVKVNDVYGIGLFCHVDGGCLLRRW